MQFNSFRFLAFFALVATTYFAMPKRLRWVLLLVASYYFYMCWKPEYAVLILGSTITAYATAIAMATCADRPGTRRVWLLVSLLTNLGVLFGFKYYNFFNESLRAALQALHLPAMLPTSSLLLPVGISFYTFQTLSYTLDVYRGEREPERHFGLFAVYVSFFPQLVAGPIERSTQLLPQFRHEHVFDYDRVVRGLRLMTWGFVKKIVIADRLAVYVNQVYGSPANYGSLPLALATYFFAFQIYCDFSAYSDIAIGAGRVMGYELMTNFRSPYLSRSIAEFWQRWHISLSTWFRDYLYIPLGGSRRSRRRTGLNVLIVFLVSGLWHGANWTFVAWGALHGLYIVAAAALSDVSARIGRAFARVRAGSLWSAARLFLTFHAVLLAWVLFRADSMADAALIFRRLLATPDLRIGYGSLAVGLARGDVLMMGLSCVVLIWMEHDDRVHRWMCHRLAAVRWSTYITLLLTLVTCGFYKPSEFIYFQF